MSRIRAFRIAVLLALASFPPGTAPADWRLMAFEQLESASRSL